MTKAFIFILICQVLVIAFGQNQDYSYQEYEQKFQKKHKGLQRQKHKQAFQKNLEKFKQAKKNNPHLEVNWLLDWTDEELKKFINFKPEDKKDFKQPNRRRLLQTSSYPSSFDYRSHGKVTHVKNQGDCGSCWAFAATAAYQSHMLLQNNITYYSLTTNQSQFWDMAEQYPLDCDLSSIGCNGGLPRTALTLLNSTGAPYQNLFPYTNNQSVNRTQICESTQNYTKLTTLATSIYFDYDLYDDEVIYELLTYGPFPIGVTANDTNFMYVGPTGIINNCLSGQHINHAILLVGYNSSYWIVKNSWGEGWGDQGYAYISRINDCGLKSYVVHFRTMVYGSYPLPVPPPPPPPQPVNITLRVNMTDSRNDGWGWTLGFRQNSTIVANFTLASGGFGFVDVTINSQLNTNIVVTKSGTAKTIQIGYTVYDPSKNITLATRVAGSSFNSSTILATFCPTTCLASTVNRVSSSSPTDEDNQQTLTSLTRETEGSSIVLTKLEVGLIATVSILGTTIVFIIGIVICILKGRWKMQNDVSISNISGTRHRKLSNDSITTNSRNPMTSVIPPEM